MNSSAAVFRNSQQPFDLVSLQIPLPEAGQALVRVTCCTLCGSDLHTIRGARPIAGPTILGHEMIGLVHSLPSTGSLTDVDGQPVLVGDRITWSVAASCGCCFFCHDGLPQKCERLFKYGHEPISPTAPASGGLAEYCQLIQGTAIVKLSDALPDVVACPANCATATVAAALRTAGGVAGRFVVIHGGGMLGVTAAAMAKVEGATDILITDLLEQRCQSAMQFGATAAFVADDHDSIERAVHRATQGRGADVILEMSGAATAAERSIELLRVGGRLVLVGSVFPSRAIAISPEEVVRKMVRVEGVHNYLPTDLVDAVRFLDHHQAEFPFHELVGAEYSLGEIDRAVSRAMNSSFARVAVRPG